MRKTRYSIAVLMGGPSSEREVSLRSGRAASIALQGLGHRVSEIDVRGDKGEELLGLRADVAFLALHGRFGEDGEVQRLLEKRNLPYTGSGPSSEREVSLRSGRAASIALQGLGHRVSEIDVRGDKGEELLGLRADVAFLALHGRFGEDGEVQRLLEKRNLPYTGSGPVASRIAIDKLESKRLFIKAGVETPPYQVLTRGDGPDELEACARSLGLPLVIKPRSEGSSVGVSIHRDISRLAEGLELATRSGRTALMERFIEGREMTVGILDDKPLPVIELRNQRDLFDYAAKYQDGGTHVIVDPVLPQRDRVALQMTALRAHRALGCEGASRVDLILTPLHGIQVLEVNTIPGLTERSLLPRAARAAGIPYDELCDHMIRLAFRRRRETGSWVAAALL